MSRWTASCGSMTPERIIVVHPLAGPFRRFAAYLIDLGVLAMLDGRAGHRVGIFLSVVSSAARRPSWGRYSWPFSF